MYYSIRLKKIVRNLCDGELNYIDVHTHSQQTAIQRILLLSHPVYEMDMKKRLLGHFSQFNFFLFSKLTLYRYE